MSKPYNLVLAAAHLAWGQGRLKSAEALYTEAAMKAPTEALKDRHHASAIWARNTRILQEQCKSPNDPQYLETHEAQELREAEERANSWMVNRPNV